MVLVRSLWTINMQRNILTGWLSVLVHVHRMYALWHSLVRQESNHPVRHPGLGAATLQGPWTHFMPVSSRAMAHWQLTTHMGSGWDNHTGETYIISGSCSELSGLGPNEWHPVTWGLARSPWSRPLTASLLEGGGGGSALEQCIVQAMKLYFASVET